MADKKAPSGRKSTAASRGKAAKAGSLEPNDDKKADKEVGSPETKAVSKPGKGKTVAVKSGPQAKAPAKASVSAKASEKETPNTTSDASSAANTPSEGPQSGDAPPSGKDQPPSGKDQTPQPARTSIPPSGTKSTAINAPIGSSGPVNTSADDDKASLTGADKAGSDSAKAATTGAAASPTKASDADDAKATSPAPKPAAPTPFGTKPEHSEAATAKPSQPAATTAPKSQTARPTPAAPSNNQPKARKGGFFPLLLGGVCAAAIGFGAAYYVFPQLGIMSPTNGDSGEVAIKLADQADQISALDARIDAIPGAPDTSGFEAGQADMAAQISDLSEQVSAVTARMDEIEEQPTGQGGDGVTTGQLNELRRTIKTQGEALDKLVAQADQRDEAARASAQQDLRRAALTRIRTALDTGTPFAPALGDLERAGMSAPDALQEVAQTGVPTQTALQQSFAPAARAALAEARKAGDEDGSADFWSFMSNQLGARSLERREGPGTDAVLSRAEDDLRQGDLNAALTEVEALPDPAATELADWAARARTRMQAIAAYDALAAKLN